MNLVIIFDVSEKNGEVREAMKLNGYFGSWLINPDGPKYELPHNSLWKLNTEMKVALSDIRSVISVLNLRNAWHIELQRCIVLSVTPWDGIPGQPILSP